MWMTIGVNGWSSLRVMQCILGDAWDAPIVQNFFQTFARTRPDNVNYWRSLLEKVENSQFLVMMMKYTLQSLWTNTAHQIWEIHLMRCANRSMAEWSWWRHCCVPQHGCKPKGRCMLLGGAASLTKIELINVQQQDLIFEEIQQKITTIKMRSQH